MPRFKHVTDKPYGPVNFVAPFDRIYPPRKNCSISEHKTTSMIYHIGYTIPKAKRCKCGAYPVFEQYVDDVADDDGKKGKCRRNVPAKLFVGVCPICERKTVTYGTLNEAYRMWNSGQFDPDTEIVSKPLTDIDNFAMIDIAGKLIAGEIEDAVTLIRERHRLKEEIKNPLLGSLIKEVKEAELKQVTSELRSLQYFFERSPFMHQIDHEAILSHIRATIHPELKPDERIKIPLKLVSM